MFIFGIYVQEVHLIGLVFNSNGFKFIRSLIMSLDSLISIIVPVYKTEKFLDRCIKSIVNQTYTNIEIILVDDESPDNCPVMCDNWAKKDSRIKVLHIKNNGVANARNQGLEIATGDFIGFVDSDDFIEPEMYDTLLNEMVEKNCDIAVCDFQLDLEEKGEAISRVITPNDALKSVVIGDYKFGVLWNKLYKKSVIENVKMPMLVCCEDLVYNYFVFTKASSIIECDLKLYHYMQNTSGVTKSGFNEGSFDAIKSKEILLEDTDIKSEIRPYVVFGYVFSCFTVLKGIITNKKFINRYGELRNNILKYKKTILFSSLYSKKDKMKTILLWLSPKLYNKFLK